jgi:hypothetical protein
VKEIVTRSVVDILLLAVKELKDAYEGLEDGDAGEALRHYDRASGLLVTIDIDLDTIGEVIY